MDDASLRHGLETQGFGRNLVFYPVTDSTNTQAKETLRRQALPEGTVFVAGRQTAGRGTGSHRWESSAPESLLLSLVLQAPLRHEPLSFVPAVALIRTLREHYHIEAHLKWPNDVLAGARKLAGILCEGVGQPGGRMAWVVGVGLNVNQRAFPEPIGAMAISMRQLGGQSYAIERLFQHYLFEMERLYASQESVVQAWSACTRMIGRTIRVTQHGQSHRVNVLGVSPEGYLRVAHADGRREVWTSTTGLEIDRAY